MTYDVSCWIDGLFGSMAICCTLVLLTASTAPSDITLPKSIWILAPNLNDQPIVQGSQLFC